MQAILSSEDMHLLSPNSVSLFPTEIVEDGRTLEENAFIKALAVHSATGLPVVADDTGLEVEALDNRPGVFSARYAGEHASYQDNVEKLLTELAEHTNRKARFRTVICYRDNLRTFFAEGICEGTITTAVRGSHGFGYDPVFIPEGETRTFAEMLAEEKAQLSHRGRALREFARTAKLLLLYGQD